jgi:short subunit dehydrogenase-like uncharacterized protein
MPDAEWILYGANGYTARCITEECVRNGQRPLLAGRNASAIAELAVQTGFEQRVFGLDDAAELRLKIRGAKLVLNCAGPFSTTARPMMEACLAEGVHYLDITGEIDVIEAAAALDERAKGAGVILLPAVGFDVVPSDCLAKTLSQKLPDANHLELAQSRDGKNGPRRGRPGWSRANQWPHRARAVRVENARGALSRRPANIDDHPLGRRGERVPFDGNT